MKNRGLFLFLMCFIASPLWAGTFPELISSSTGNTYVVSTESEFNQRAASAQSGDVILVADGTYSGWQLKIPSVGTNDKPIIYTAQHPGKVTFENGSCLFRITGNHNIIGGFNIDNVGHEVFLIKGRASHNRITDNKMNGPGSLNSGRGYINIREQSHYSRIDHNEIIGAKDGIRIWLGQEALDNGPSQYTRIDHNTFKDTVPRGDNGYIIQMGQTSSGILLEVHTIFEHNYIENHYGCSSEIISNKSSYNIIRYNEIENSYGGIALRRANHCEVYGNYIHGPGSGVAAITIKGAYHKIYNNVIDAPEKIGIQMDRWGHRNYKDKNVAKIPPTHNNIIVHNTIVVYGQGKDSIKRGIKIGSINGEACRPIYNCRIINNIIIGSEGELLHVNTDNYKYGNSRCDERDWNYIEGKNDVEINNNIYCKNGTASYGSGYDLDANKVVGNPNLVDTFYLPSGSIAIDKGIVIPGISVDYYGNPRDGAPDIGAFEYSKVPPPRDVEVVAH